MCKFMRNLYHVMTGSDDAHVRIFDLATSQTVMKLKAHKVSTTLDISELIEY